MSNQLDRFQGLSETRWPAPSFQDGPSGEGRKALSRYINEYIAELEKSDSELLSQRRRTTTTPPETWEQSVPKLPMSRQEYIKRQNALFHELTGHKSWADLSSHEAVKDSKNKQLMTTIELYMAALDEKIYMSADYTRAMIGVRDQAVRDNFEQLRLDESVDAAPAEGLAALRRAAVELRDMYRDLWIQHSQLAHQRDSLEVEMSHLRYDHALQLAKVLRLEYATHSLGQKLVDAQALRSENEQLKEDMAKQQRQLELLQNSFDALQEKHTAQDEELGLLRKASEAGGSAGLEMRIQALHDELASLKASERYLASHQSEPKSPLEVLDKALALIDIGRQDADKRVSSLIESFSQQYRLREQELLTQIAVLEQEKQIVIARCEKLESETSEANADLSYLEQRTLSLVLMLKSVRASLDSTTPSPAAIKGATELSQDTADTAKPGDSQPGDSQPDGSQPYDSKPHDSKPHDSKPDGSKSESAKSESAKFDASRSDLSTPDLRAPLKPEPDVQAP